MGATVSAGMDNDELVDNLLEADYIKTVAVERVFRAVDRGHYFTLESRDNAYKDLAWKYGNVHISAPCIYSEVMENLQLGPGMSFLNLGSGTGYLSTMAGLILGANGINHGVEVHEDVVEYAKNRLEEFCMTSPAVDEYEFCQPKFVSGNCLNLEAGARLYDRVYCGAACPENQEDYMKNLIKVGGILVMPINNQLLQIFRISEDLWETRTVLPVSFASLVNNSPDNFETVKLPEAEPLSLQDICRFAIRSILRQQINKEHPEMRTDTVHGSRTRIKKRTLRKFVIPIFGNNAENQSEITPEDINGLRDFGRRGFLMDVQSVRSCRTLLELLPGPSNRMQTVQGNVQEVYGGYEEQDYEDLDDYENLNEEGLGNLEALQANNDNANNSNNDNNDNNNESDDDEDNDNNDDNDNDAQGDNEVNVDDSAEGGTQENEINDFGGALQGLDNPEEQRGTDDTEMMETDSEIMTMSQERESTINSTDEGIEIGNGGTTEVSANNYTNTSTQSSIDSTTPGSSEMVTENTNTSPTVCTNSTGNTSMTIMNTAGNSAQNPIFNSTMIARNAAGGSSRAMPRMSARMNSMMSSMMGDRMRNRMALRVGSRPGSRMGARMTARVETRMRRTTEQDERVDNAMGSQFMRHIAMGQTPQANPARCVENFEPDDRLLVRIHNPNGEAFLNGIDGEDMPINYSTYMREKINLLPLPMSLKYFINLNRDL